MQRFVAVGVTLLIVMACALALYVAGSHWYISDPELADGLRQFHLFTLFNIHIDWLGELPKITVKEQLDAGDAFANALSFVVAVATTIPLLILLMILALIVSLVTGKWGEFLLLAFAGFVMLALLPIIVVVFWLVLLIQPCTLGYAFWWIVLAIPAVAAGASSNLFAVKGVGAVAAGGGISGFTKKRTDVLGRDKEIHYDDDGNKIGETRFKRDWLGRAKQEHYDDAGNKIGETRRGYDWLGRDRAEHVDEHGTPIGYSRDDVDWLARPVQRHFETSGEGVGETRRKEGFWTPRKEHRGTFFKAKPSTSQAEGEQHVSAGSPFFSASVSPWAVGLLILTAVVVFALVLSEPSDSPTSLSSAADEAEVSATALNVRAGPSTRYRVLATVNRGQRVRVVECQAAWCLVDLASVGVEGRGWVSKRYIRLPGQEPVSATPEPQVPQPTRSTESSATRRRPSPSATRATPPPPRRPVVSRQARVVAFSPERQGYNVRVVLDSVVTRSGLLQTHLSVTNLTDQVIYYLLYQRHQLASARIDRWTVVDAQGRSSEWKRALGIEEYQPYTYGGQWMACLLLPPNTRATFGLEFESGVSAGRVTLVHTQSPRVLFMAKCPGTVVAFPDFTLAGNMIASLGDNPE